MTEIYLTDEEERVAAAPAAKPISQLLRGIFNPAVQTLNHEWQKAAYGVTESPLEDRMSLGLAWLSVETTGVRLVRNHSGGDYVAGPHYDPNCEIQIHVHRQYPVGRRRLDFGMEVFSEGRRVAVLAIECDGADYHSSPEQVAADLERDASLLRLGVHTIRFLGRRIYDNACACANEALDYAVRLYGAAKKAPSV